jgi:hypothetical protein
LTTSDADTTTDQSLASEGAESEDISKDAGLPCSPSGSDEPDDSQESHQSSVSEGDKLHGELPEDIPVALRTRSRRQRQDAHITFDVNDILDRSQIGKEVKELILQLIEQNEEQKNKLSSAIQSHKTIVRELQGDIAKLHKQMSSQKFKVSFPNSDHRRVKRFRPTGKSNVKKSSRSCGLSASAARLPESPTSEDEIHEANMARVKEAEAALLEHVLWRHEYDAKGSDELYDPVPDTSELDGSAESESLSHDYKESVTDTSDNLDASTESEPPSPRDIRLNNDKSRGYKRGSYVPPKESEKDRAKAKARISKALDQVDLSVHLNPQGKRKTATLYVGNLAFNTSEQDLGESLDKVFRKIRVEKITIPRVDGRSKYGFIEISWAHRAPVKLADLCIKNSGMIQVKSRPIYFRELRNKDEN